MSYKEDEKRNWFDIVMSIVKLIVFGVVSLALADLTINIFAVYIDPSKAMIYAVSLFIFYFAVLAKGERI